MKKGFLIFALCSLTINIFGILTLVPERIVTQTNKQVTKDSHFKEIENAKQQFTCMSTKKINKINLAELTPAELQGFKELSIELFHKEIASAYCNSQANRVKSQVMYAKLGQI